MATDDFAAFGDDIAGVGRNVAREELTKRPLADEADAGAVGLVEHRQARFACQRAHLGLREVAQWEQHAREVLARDRVQEIRLVLVRVARLAQHGSGAFVLESRVMPGGEACGPEACGVGEADAELDLAVAQHVGVRRAAGAILGEEVVEYPRAVFGGEADAMQWNVRARRRRARASWKSWAPVQYESSSSQLLM